MFGMGMQELVIIGIIAILLFGKNLPQVAKTLGKYYRDFRRGLGDIQSSFDFTSDITSPTPSRSSKSYSRSSYDDYDYDDADEATAPKFTPPPSEPKLTAPQEENAA